MRHMRPEYELYAIEEAAASTFWLIEPEWCVPGTVSVLTPCKTAPLGARSDRTE